jgi:hypothetical protein
VKASRRPTASGIRRGDRRRIRAVVEDYDTRMIVDEVYLLDLKKLVAYINIGEGARW